MRLNRLVDEHEKKIEQPVRKLSLKGRMKLSNVLDKILLAGLGLENKISEKVNELAEEGKRSTEEGLKTGQDLENKAVEDIVKIVGRALKKVGVAKKEVDAILDGLAEELTGRLKLVTLDELDVVEKMALKSREKVDKMERRIKKLEKTVKTLSEAGNKE